jgi:small conductance mechanosensitive channel
VGDNVDLGEAVGTVESLSLRATTLRGIDGTQWHVPNGVIVRVGNRSKAWANGQLDVTVTYDADVDHALVVLKRVVEEVCGREEFSSVVLEPPKVLGVESLNLEGVVLRVVVKTVAGEQWTLMREIRSVVKHEFDVENIPLKPPVVPPPPRPPA